MSKSSSTWFGPYTLKWYQKMALILLCAEDVEPTASTVTCVTNNRICYIILQLWPIDQCLITPLTKNEIEPQFWQTGPNQVELELALSKSSSTWFGPYTLKWYQKMALILLCAEDVEPTASTVTCVTNNRICYIILQLWPIDQCLITPLTKNEIEPQFWQTGPNQVELDLDQDRIK